MKISILPALPVEKLGYTNMTYNSSNSNAPIGNVDTQTKVAQCFVADQTISTDTINIGCLVTGSPQYALKCSVYTDSGGTP
jgi:hypothetical protein